MTEKFEAAKLLVAERMQLIREHTKSEPTKKFEVSFLPDFLNNLFKLVIDSMIFRHTICKARNIFKTGFFNQL